MEATKRCPFCAEEILAAARKCKHCGSELKLEIERRHRPIKFYAGVFGLGILCVLGFVDTCGHTSTNNSSTNSGSPVADSPPVVEAPILRITAQELKDRYDDNEVAANQRFQGYRLEISGSITSIDEDFLGSPTVNLETDNSYESVHIKLPKEQSSVVAQLTRGQVFAVRCETIQRIIALPVASDCVIVANSAQP